MLRDLHDIARVAALQRGLVGATDKELALVELLRGLYAEAVRTERVRRKLTDRGVLL